MDLPFALEGFFFEKVNRSTGQRVTFAFHYIYQPHTTQLQKAPFALVPQLQSLIRCLFLLHINGIWTSQLLLRGSFSKGSTGQRVNGSNGSTGHFYFHYIIYDSRQRQAHATPLQKAHGLNGSTGQWVHGSTGQTGRLVNGSLSLSLYYI